MRIELSEPLSLSEIKNALHINSDTPNNTLFNAITTNSKECMPGDLFIALNGAKQSGNDFLFEAVKSGAFTLSNTDLYTDIKVDDAEAALLSIAEYYKDKKLNIKTTVAITGSVGKTTLKDILSLILKNKYKTHSTYKNFNNRIGVSYTVLSAKKETEILICELGMNHQGEISALSNALKPDIAVITNIGNAHIGNLGSMENIAKAKLEITDGMNKPILVIPYGERLLQPDIPFYSFSDINENADCYIEKKGRKNNSIIVDIRTKSYKLNSVPVNSFSDHIVKALSAAVSVLDIMNIDKDTVLDGILKINSDIIRAKFIEFCNFRIYDDSYSSSPEAVLSVLKNLKNQSQSVSCVLGDMLELGEKAEELHKRIGKAAYEYGYRKIYTFGEFSDFIKEGAITAGMNKKDILINYDINSPSVTAKMILENASLGETVLIKASNSVKAYRIIDFLKTMQ